MTHAEKTCGQCGHALGADDRYCPQCGQQVDGPAEVETPGKSFRDRIETK